MRLKRSFLAFSLLCISQFSYANYDSYNGFEYDDSSFSQCCDNRFFVKGEFLYWKADQDGMTYALSVNELDSFGSESRALQQSGKWSPAFRLGAGWAPQTGCWDLAVYWTRFHNKAFTSSSDPFIIGTQLLSISSPFTIGGSGSDAGIPTSRWDLEFDTIELLAGSDISFNRMVLHPYLGVIAARINQTQTINYNDFLDTTFAVHFNAEIREVNDFSGVGPKLGLGGRYEMNYGLDLCGDLATSLLYGHSKHPVTTIVLDDPLGFPNPVTVSEYDRDALLPFVQGKVGLTWNAMCVNRFQVKLGVFYEAQYFWNTSRNQNSATQFVYITDAGYGSLMLHGWTLALDVGF